MIAKELLAEERRIQVSSAVIALIIMLSLLGAAFVWWASRERVPPPGKEYEVLGAIDFGNMKAGSKKINNFEPPKEEAAETPPNPAKPTQAPVDDSDPQPEPIETQPDPSPISEPPAEVTPDPKPTPPKEKETIKPSEEQKTDNNTDSKETESKPEKPKRDPLDFDLGGSNDGDSDDTGNKGTPDMKELDPNGLYSFGESQGGGASQRAPLDLPYPAYNAQEEGKLTFEFIILPNGRVGSVRVVSAVGPNQTRIRDAGINAIRKWRFTKLPSNKAQVNQKLRVTMTFKLKG